MADRKTVKVWLRCDALCDVEASLVNGDVDIQSIEPSPESGSVMAPYAETLSAVELLRIEGALKKEDDNA
jgi:hypothetical protein